MASYHCRTMKNNTADKKRRHVKFLGAYTTVAAVLIMLMMMSWASPLSVTSAQAQVTPDDLRPLVGQTTQGGGPPGPGPPNGPPPPPGGGGPPVPPSGGGPGPPPQRGGGGCPPPQLSGPCGPPPP